MWFKIIWTLDSLMMEMRTAAWQWTVRASWWMATRFYMYVENT